MTMRTLYLESFAGIAGDMFTAAFLDAGLVDPEVIRAVPGLLDFPGVEVEITGTQRAQAHFTKVRVVLPDGSSEGHGGPSGNGPDQDRDAHPNDHHDHHHHHDHHDHHHDHYHYSALVRRLEASKLDPVAIEFALRVFRLLAEAEAESHGVPVEKVAFHEVGAVDSVVDVAMAGVCLSAVAPDRVLASPVKLGRGTIRIQHGTYPVPPPASARLAIGMPVAQVPEEIIGPNLELSTPTGLAILKALDPEFLEGWPPGILVAQGSGAGTRDLGDYPNVFRVALMEESDDVDGAKPSHGVSGTATNDGTDPALDGSDPALDGFPYETDTVVELLCNVDDQTGERTAWLMKRALEIGALDAWVTQVVGKKGRPSACMTFLVNPQDLLRVSDFLLRHSSTFGVRYAPYGRFKLVREEEIRDTPDGPVSFKIGRTLDGEVVKEKPEFEDLRRIWEEDPED